MIGYLILQSSGFKHIKHNTMGSLVVKLAPVLRYARSFFTIITSQFGIVKSIQSGSKMAFDKSF